MEKPPPPGISSIGEGGSRQAIEPEASVSKTAAKTPQRRQAFRNVGGDHVLRNLEKNGGGRQVQTNIPAGVNAHDQNVLELPMPHMKMPASSTCSFRSVDGEEYTFRVRDGKGRPVPYRNEMALYLALIEVAKGGSPLPIFNAFKLKMEDFNGKQVYPFPHQQSLLPLPEEVTEAEEAEPNTSFSIGE